MRQAGEPSVEEILESIKKVIARDNRETALADRRRREQDGFSRAAAFEPPARNAEASSTDAAASNADHDDEDAILELDELAEAADAPEEGLTNPEAAAAMRQSLAALAMLAEPSARPQIVRSGETSLEGLVRDMLRPMLAQWLDTHLPKIVEEQVRAEIARIAGKHR